MTKAYKNRKKVESKNKGTKTLRKIYYDEIVKKFVIVL